MFDVIIVGAGVSGCAVARELSRYDMKTAVLERASDVCEGTSKANSGIVHAGYDAEPGTVKALLNIRGSRRMEELSEELDFPYKRNGSLVLCFEESGRRKLQELLERGKENGVEDLCILEREELVRIEPNISEQAAAALYAPTGGIVCPFGLTIALAENACVNGVEFYLDTEVGKVEKTEAGYRLETSRGLFESRTVVNAAGVYADIFHNMVSSRKIHITPRKGEYCLFDKTAGDWVRHTVFQLPTQYGKGVLVTPTVHGNLLVGPTAEDIEDKEGVYTTGEGLADLLERGNLSVREVPAGKVITSFAGLRAHEDGGDFVIGEPEDAAGFIDVAGIESPGLTCAPAIGEYVADLIRKRIPAPEKADFIAGRKGIPSVALADEERRQELIRENPAYANVVCRCELVTEGEIADAIHRPLGATTLDGVKRRTRAGMGRCQSGFCAPKTAEILARELGKDLGEISKAGGASLLLAGHSRPQGSDCVEMSKEAGHTDRLLRQEGREA